MFEPIAQSDQEKGVNSLGSRFAAAREARGIPMDQAAHDTRIRAQRLREIENDDLSHFSHPSYARMFLTDYARYLGIPHAEISDSLPQPGAVGSEGYQYLQDNFGKQPYRPFPRASRPRRRLRTVVFGTLTLLACSFLALEITITVRKLDRVNRVSQQDATHLAPDAASPEASPEDHPVANPPVSAVMDEPSSTEIAEVSSSETLQPSAPSPLFIGGAVDHGSAVR